MLTWKENQLLICNKQTSVLNQNRVPNMKTIDYLTLKVPVKIVADNILFFFFFNFLFQEKKAEYFIGTVCIETIHMKMSSLIFLEKWKTKIIWNVVNCYDWHDKE